MPDRVSLGIFPIRTLNTNSKVCNLYKLLRHLNFDTEHYVFTLANALERLSKQYVESGTGLLLGAELLRVEARSGYMLDQSYDGVFRSYPRVNWWQFFLEGNATDSAGKPVENTSPILEQEKIRRVATWHIRRRVPLRTQ